MKNHCLVFLLIFTIFLGDGLFFSSAIVTSAQGTGGAIGITTNSVESIGQTTATSGGTFTAAGNPVAHIKGVVWGTSSNPVYTVGGINQTEQGYGSVYFTSSITSLTCATTYYVRAYAIGGAEFGTVYGSNVSFTTLPCKPTVTTDDPVTNITSTTATVGGKVTTNGGASVTQRGAVWGTSSSPNIEAYATTGNASAWTSPLTSLACATTYYVKAWATNSAGRGYGDNVTFTTLACYALTIPISTGTGSGAYGGTTAGTYSTGTNVSITATPSTGSTFTKWTATGAAVACNNTTTSPCAFSLTSVASVTAVYTLNTYALTKVFSRNHANIGSSKRFY